jgi:hypothetical protein
MITSMRLLIFLATIFFGSAEGSASGLQYLDDWPGLSSAAQRALDAIRSGDVDALAGMAEDRSELEPGTVQGQVTLTMLFDTGAYAPWGKKPLQALASEDPIMRATPLPSGGVDVYFVVRSAHGEVTSRDFFVRELMRRYFVCTFSRAADVWQISSPFCYAATEGPIPPESD